MSLLYSSFYNHTITLQILGYTWFCEIFKPRWNNQIGHEIKIPNIISEQIIASVLAVCYTVTLPISNRFLIHAVVAAWNSIPDSNFHGAHTRPTWVLSAPGGPHEPCYPGCYLTDLSLLLQIKCIVVARANVKKEKGFALNDFQLQQNVHFLDNFCKCAPGVN